MNTPNFWSNMYTSHTCYKALSASFAQLKQGLRFELENEAVPPCRVCRAWWREACHRFGIVANFRWPGGTWTADGPPPKCISHNRLVPFSAPDDRGMLVIAEENQGCARWGHIVTHSADPEIFQSDLVDHLFGPWIPTGVSRSMFTTLFDYWNQANGGADVTLFGQASKETTMKLKDFHATSGSREFIIYESNSVFIAVTSDGDVYMWGTDSKRLRETASHVELAWSDLEQV